MEITSLTATSLLIHRDKSMIRVELKKIEKEWVREADFLSKGTWKRKA